MERPTSIATYLRAFTTELGERILESFPPLHGAEDPVSESPGPDDPRPTALL